MLIKIIYTKRLFFNALFNYRKNNNQRHSRSSKRLSEKKELERKSTARD
jgi:hypothetical protein